MTTEDDDRAVTPERIDHGEDARLTIQGLNDQARDVMLFPSFALNVLSNGNEISLVLEFHRTPGVAVDATVVQLNWAQARALASFLAQEVGEMTELDAVHRMYGPTKERPQ